MPILTRQPGHSITIGDEITVTVLSVKGNQVRIGIEAPKNINVMRPYAKVQQPKLAS